MKIVKDKMKEVCYSQLGTQRLLFFSPGGKYLDFILHKTGSHRFLTKAVHDYYFINIYQTGCYNGLLWGEKIEVGRSIKRVVN